MRKSACVSIAMGPRAVVKIGTLILALVLLPATAYAAPDAAAGGALFRARCQTCHAAVAGKPALLGPNLAGVLGRPAAATAFAYSPALRASKLKWDAATLDRFLAAPMKLVPGTRMIVAVPDARQRGDVIGYLATLGK